MDLNDLYKLAGISRDDAPAIEPQPVEQVAEQPTDGREDMRAMIALITPGQLNQLVGEAPVEEGDEYAASTTPNPQEYKGTLGSPSDNSLRRYLDAAGDHVTIDEDVYPDHTVENVSEAYKSFKAKHKTEAYSPGDENEEGMVSNCCGAPIMDVYQGHGRCSDCKEMASAVKESIQESSADDFLKSLNQDPLYFPGAQITKNDDGSITLVASNGEEVADIDVKTGDIVLVNGDDYNIADDEDAEQNLQTMYAEINGDNGDMDMDEAADGEITKASVKKSALELLVDIAKTSKQYKGEVTDDQVHYLGSLVHDFDMAGIETEAYSEIEKLFRTMAVTHKADMTMIQPAYAQAKALDESLDEADVEENAFNQAAAAAARAGKDSFEFGGKKHKTTMKKDTAHKLDDDINSLKQEAAIGAPDYNPSKGSYADMPTQVKLAGDSIWDKEKSNPEMVTVTDVEVVEGDEGYVEVTVEHDGPWTIYTDSGFEEAISDMIDMEVSFSEQGMQEDGRAHLEGNDEDVTLERIKKLSGI
jgi:hypothetical protein